MGALFVWSLLVALVGSVIGAFIYGGWNLVLAPWMAWREMPVSVALFLGAILAAMSVSVKVRR